MKRRLRHNRRGIAWLLSVAFVLMATASGTSWQCLDGHPCPPGCTMQHLGEHAQETRASALPACCQPQQNAKASAEHCALCSTARATNTRVTEACTSSICVLRIKAKPDLTAPVHLLFLFDSPAILLPGPAPLLVAQETDVLAFGSPRAPPERRVLRLTSPRAPPVLL